MEGFKIKGIKPEIVLQILNCIGNEGTIYKAIIAV